MWKSACVGVYQLLKGFQFQNQLLLLVKIFMTLFLCLLKQQTAKPYGGLETQFELFLTCALDVDERLA